MLQVFFFLCSFCHEMADGHSANDCARNRNNEPHEASWSWYRLILILSFSSYSVFWMNLACVAVVNKKKIWNYFRSIITIRNQLSWIFYLLDYCGIKVYSHAGRVLDPYRVVQRNRTKLWMCPKLYVVDLYFLLACYRFALKDVSPLCQLL